MKSMKGKNYTRYFYIPEVLKISHTKKPFVKATYLRLKHDHHTNH